VRVHIQKSLELFLFEDIALRGEMVGIVSIVARSKQQSALSVEHQEGYDSREIRRFQSITFAIVKFASWELAGLARPPRDPVNLL